MSALLPARASRSPSPRHPAQASTCLWRICTSDRGASAGTRRTPTRTRSGGGRGPLARCCQPEWQGAGLVRGSHKPERKLRASLGSSSRCLQRRNVHGNAAELPLTDLTATHRLVRRWLLGASPLEGQLEDKAPGRAGPPVRSRGTVAAAWQLRLAPWTRELGSASWPKTRRPSRLLSLRYVSLSRDPTKLSLG
jgi:hypothetical protein